MITSSAIDPQPLPDTYHAHFGAQVSGRALESWIQSYLIFSWLDGSHNVLAIAYWMPVTVLLHWKLLDLCIWFSSNNLFNLKLSHLDCEILPKLHHLRVASACLKSYQLPPEFVGIWRYLHNAYNNDIFQKACPPDQVIEELHCSPIGILM